MSRNQRFIFRLVIVLLVALFLCGIMAIGGYLLLRRPATIPAPECAVPEECAVAPVAPVVQQPCYPTPVPAKATVIDCGPWHLENNVLVFGGNVHQDVCQKGADLASTRAGITSRFTRSSSFTMQICAADISNDQGGHWTFTDCDQSGTTVFPAGVYTVTQPKGYANGGYRATNK